MYLLGLDIGSSSIKAAVVRAVDHQPMGSAQQPTTEMEIIAVKPGWAEQHPELWWEYTQSAIKQAIEKAGIDGVLIQGIGISYQMHGLVLIDKDQKPLRPAIIWCDSRAVAIGNTAYEQLGPTHCLQHMLNSPGNFTASKLKWVKDNEPDLYARIYKAMLPGDYINMMLTGEVNTTLSGLSEGILWDFKQHSIAYSVLDHYGIDKQLLPMVLPSLSEQGTVTATVAKILGISPKAKVTYRAGDQPNNAMALGVLEPGQIAATGGTSGVVYGVTDQYAYDTKSRVNGFAHVNHTKENKRIGILLCINGAGIQYAWLKKNMTDAGTTYADMEQAMAAIPIGSDGLRILPFGNGAERLLENKSPGATVTNLQFNRHGRAHMYRAALEGIAYSYVYGCDLLQELGLHPSLIRVGNDNLFRSRIFAETVAHLLDTTIEVVDTNGAVGAAKASGVAIGAYSTLSEAVSSTTVEHRYTPSNTIDPYQAAYEQWKRDLLTIIN